MDDSPIVPLAPSADGPARADFHDPPSDRPFRPDILHTLASAVPPTEAAKLLRCSVGSIWRYVLDHKLESLKVGGKRLIPLDAIREFVQRDNTPIRSAPTGRTDTQRRDAAETALNECRRLGV